MSTTDLVDIFKDFFKDAPLTSKHHKGLWQYHASDYAIAADAIEVAFITYATHKKGLHDNYDYFIVTLTRDNPTDMLKNLMNYVEIPNLTRLEKIIYGIN
jgi:hypothetical protein